MKNKVVIFCKDCYPGLGLIRSLGEAGYKPECYCYGKKSEYLLASKYVSKGLSFRSAEEILDYLVREYPCYDDKPILFTVPDMPAYLVDCHQNQLKNKFILMTAGEQGRIGYWMDKRNVVQIAQKYGLITPWTLELSKDEEIPESISYPVFTKSIRTVDGGKGDESICWNKEELEVKRSTIVSDRFLVTKYVKKKQEISFFGMSMKGKVYIDYHDEIERFSDGAFGFYGVFKNFDYDDIRQKSVSMMEEIGYEGLFDVEYLLGDDGVFYFMEVNFRVDGAIYKLLPGVNLPAEWCRLINMPKEDLPDHLPLKKPFFSGMTEHHDFRTSVLTGKMSPIKWFWEFCTADKHMLINLKDPRPVLVWVYCFIRHKEILKVLRRSI